MKKETSSSWQAVGKWYDTTVGEQGHYYHQHVVIPKTLDLLKTQDGSSLCLLDLACGQGILGRALPHVEYVGLDVAPHLIRAAQGYNKYLHHRYEVADVTKPLPQVAKKKFTHATIILALQNIESPELVIQNAYQALSSQGTLVIVLNHPCFRIPRQSSWGIDEEKKLQYRRVDRYMSALNIPVQAHPSQGERSVSTLSFHHPLSSYSKWLKKAGFFIESIEEWISDKVSEGKAARMENRSREEFPLFLTLVAKRL